jgi:hypothetical protein
MKTTILPVCLQETGKNSHPVVMGTLAHIVSLVAARPFLLRGSSGCPNEPGAFFRIFPFRKNIVRYSQIYSFFRKALSCSGFQPVIPEQVYSLKNIKSHQISSGPCRFSPAPAPKLLDSGIIRTIIPIHS